MMICAQSSVGSLKAAARQTPVRTACTPIPRVHAVVAPRRKAREVSCPASTSSSNGDSHAGYAVLHDFCMTLPYGTIALLAGAVCFFLGPPLKALALPLAGTGAAVLALAVSSLKGWKQGKSSAPLTLLSAGGAGGVAYLCTPLVQGSTVTSWVAGGLAALSGAAALFCLYNVMAGGNPPRKGSH